jgi:hypothetical protein
MDSIIRAVLFIATAVPALAQPWVNTGNVERVVYRLPNPITVDGVGVVHNAPWSLYVAAGWRVLERCPGIAGSNVTFRVRVDDGETVREECEYAEAIPAPQLPDQFENGIAVQRDGHWIEFVPHEGGVIAVQISDSPIDSATRDARIAAAVASASSSKSTWRTDMRTFRGSVSTNIADVQAIAALPAGFTAAQNRAAVNALRSELIDAFREINQLRKLLRQYAREQAED